MVLGLLDGHPFLSSPVMFCITREQHPGGCTPQPPMSDCHLGLVGRRHCHQIRGLGEGEAGGWFPLCSLPWRHLCPISCQRNLLEWQLPPWSWALASLPLLCVLYRFLLWAIPRLPWCFLFGFLAFLSPLKPIPWIKFPSLELLIGLCALAWTQTKFPLKYQVCWS